LLLGEDALPEFVPSSKGGQEKENQARKKKKRCEQEDFFFFDVRVAFLHANSYE
jgi:hypothetical protein